MKRVSIRVIAIGALIVGAVMVHADVTRDACEQLCECSADKTTVNCVGRGIVNLDAVAFPKEALMVNLSLNAIATLNKNALFPATKVQVLDLSFNTLSSISDAAFSGLPLQHLNLSYSTFTTLQSSLFTGLSALVSLNMSYSQLETLPSLPLPALTTLDVRASKLTLLNSLSAAPQLSYLNLNYNFDLNITSWSFFQELGASLEHLGVGGLSLPPFDSTSFGATSKLQMLDLDAALTPSLAPGTFTPVASTLQQLSMGGFRVINATSRLTRPLDTSVFNGLVNLERLNLNFVELAPTTTFGATLTSLQYLDLRHTGLVNITSAFFSSDLAALVNLYLPSSLTYLPANMFASLTNLQTLVVTTCPTLALEPQTFQGLAKLTILSLEFSKLATGLPLGVFDPLVALQYAYLASTGLTHLSDSLFAHTSQLEHLELVGNNFANASVPATLLQSTPLLRIVDLSVASLNYVPPTLLKGLVNLEMLFLQEQRISVLPSGFFDSTTQLRLLDISRNQLANTNASIFAPLVQLQHLNMSHNFFDDAFLSASPFASLVHLNLLAMANNRGITFMSPRDLFASQHNLTTLLLTGCSITSFVPDVFDQFSNLKILSLSNNALDDSSLDESVFSNMLSLEILDLSGNLVTTLVDSVFAPLTRLRILTLDHNRLLSLGTVFGPYAGPNYQLTTFSATFNNISSIASTAFFIMPHLQSIYLSGNRLNETDFLSSLVSLDTAVLNDNFLTVEAVNDAIHAKSLLDLANNRLTSIPAAALGPRTVVLTGNPFPGPICPAGTYGTFPSGCTVCDLGCLTSASFADVVPVTCSGPGPTECCPQGLSGPGCAYVVSCASSPCDPYGSCIYTQNDLGVTVPVCECQRGYLSFQGLYGPSCVTSCPDHSYRSGPNSCAQCSSSCSHGCSGPLSSDCSFLWAHQGLIIGLSVAILFIVVGALAFCFVAYKRQQRNALPAFARQARNRAPSQVPDDDEETIADGGPLVSNWRISSRDVALSEKVGRSSFGDVWLGLYEANTVIVRVIDEHIAPRIHDLPAHFISEAALLVSLSHRNVLKFFGTGAFDEAHRFFVFDRPLNGNVRALLNDTTRDVSWALRTRMLHDAARGMRYLHQCSPPVLHRELRCTSLYIDASWTVLVGDCGLVEMVETLRVGSRNLELTNLVTVYDHDEDNLRQPLISSSHGAAGSSSSGGGGGGGDSSPLGRSSVQVPRVRGASVLGRPGIEPALPWTAPEVLSEHNFLPASDVYSFGVVIWEMGCRPHLPFAEMTRPREIVAAVLNGSRPSTNALDRTMPSELMHLMQRCWRQDVIARPSFADLVVEISHIDIS